MMYIKVDENGNPVDYPINHDNVGYLLGDNEFTDENLAALQLRVIKNYDQPNFDAEYQYAERGEILKNDAGDIEQFWKITEIDNVEKIRRWIVGPRQYKLLMSDWTQARDCPLSEEKIAEWAEFRKQLRNMTDDIDFSTISHASEIEWPTPPGPLLPEDKWGMPTPDLD